MELQTAIEILEYHQEWRLGKREDMIHEPKKLTEALDLVLNEVKKFRLGAASGSRFQSAYAQYWDMVKDIIDEEGWVYTKEAPHMLDAYFEGNTGKPIEFQKSFGKSGDNPHWLTRGSRWRPSELS